MCELGLCGVTVGAIDATLSEEGYLTSSGSRWPSRNDGRVVVRLLLNHGIQPVCGADSKLEEYTLEYQNKLRRVDELEDDPRAIDLSNRLRLEPLVAIGSSPRAMRCPEAADAAPSSPASRLSLPLQPIDRHSSPNRNAISNRNVHSDPRPVDGLESNRAGPLVVATHTAVEEQEQLRPQNGESVELRVATRGPCGLLT